MDLDATREIYWNLNPFWSSNILYLLCLIALFIALSGIAQRIELYLTGQSVKLKPCLSGIRSFFYSGVLQLRIWRNKQVGFIHSLFLFGFLMLFFVTLILFLHYDWGWEIYRGKIYLALTLLSEFFGLAILIACVLAGRRRYCARSDFVHNTPADRFMILIPALLCLQGFAMEGLRIYVTNDPWQLYAPIGYLVAKVCRIFPPAIALFLHALIWWFHASTVLFLIAVFPYTRFYHMLISSVLILIDQQAGSTLSSPGDIQKRFEEVEDFTIGLETIKNYSIKQLIELDACTGCGRCEQGCPAYASGKALSPKWMILDTRAHASGLHCRGKFAQSIMPRALQRLHSALSFRALAQEGYILNPHGEGLICADGMHRSRNTNVQHSAKNLARNPDDAISGGVMNKNVFWSCTTCRACVEQCPVGINHIDHIVGNRRNMLLMQGDMPSGIKPALKALAKRGNPFGAAEDRTLWIGDLDVPILKPGDTVDYLFWVGCIVAYDVRKRKIARALSTLMTKAGLSFGVLGEAELCTGDFARRLGDENLFQELAKENIKTLQSVNFQTLVSTCPHCIHTLANEYPEFGKIGNPQPRIMHHTELLQDLYNKQKLNLISANKDLTFHDPCYLGRYSNTYSAPRKLLEAVSGKAPLEMTQHKKNSMCCGAGGGQFWLDIKDGQRINLMRYEQAAATGARTLVTACPFCLHMLEDGAKQRNKADGAMEIKDIAEMLV